MPLNLSGAQADAKDAGTKAALDSVTKKKLRVDIDAAGNVEGGINVTKGKLTFTAYVRALIKGPSKAVAAGGRIEADF